MSHPLILIVLLPLAGFAVNGLAGKRLGRILVTAVGCGLPILAFALAVKCFIDLEAGGGEALADHAYTWAVIGGGPFEVSFYLDALSAVMVLIVTGVGSLIHVYSAGYMKEDPAYARYFCYLNLFLFFMLTLVLGGSLLVLFVGWEGVALASYLLIGFWFEDPDKARAGTKAFIVNRIGDAGFLLGMFVLYQGLGTLDMVSINAAFNAAAPPALSASLVGILLFIGATGKSAQIPLHVWLPDAMAGPTPVSALIHAATMVTAGVYLVARLSGVYIHAAQASTLIAAIGAFTAFFAATIALVQTDIKKVLAYSTISQLGFMFLAAGVGAYGVAIFHLCTHAFFKACLFLAAGSVIHALDGEQDVRKMGGLARRIPLTFVTFALATAAIAGIPPLSGFFSKDKILWYAFASGRGGSALLYALAVTTALLTALYMFRLLWLTFLGPSRMDPKSARQVHEPGLSMTGVLVVLAALSAAGGLLPVPQLLESVLPPPVLRGDLEPLEVPLALVAVVAAFAGLALAAFLYAGNARRAEGLRRRFPVLQRVLSGQYYVDELYQQVIVRPLYWFCDRVLLCLAEQKVIDASVNGLAALGRRTAGVLSRVQNGNLQIYVLLVVLGTVVSIAWSWRHG